MWRYFVKINVLFLSAAGILIAHLLVLSSAKVMLKNKGADLILLNGTIITMEPNMPRASAIAIKGEKILKVGSDKEIRSLAGPGCRILNLDGQTVIPGLIDAHFHFLSIGYSKRILNFSGIRDKQAILKMVANKAAQLAEGKWIIGSGWDQNLWPERKFPSRFDLDRIAPEHPVWLTRICGHAGWANSKAMELAKITKNTPDPPGGKIHKDHRTGKPTGILVDTAEELISRLIPEPGYREKKDDAITAMKACLSVGLTGGHDAGVDLDTIKIYKELIDEGSFDFRIYAMISAQDEAAEIYLKRGPEIGYGNHRLTLRSFKLFADGALGSRGAAFYQPYCDDPGNCGLITLNQDAAYKLMIRALKHNFQVNIHCIGAKANGMVLDLYQKALNEVPVEDHRFRIEHASVLRPADFERFSRLRAVASMQPTHCTSDMPWAEARVGAKRINQTYAWRTFLNNGVKIAGGSDAPVESENPFFGIYAAITRQDQKGWPEGGWHPEQRLTREEALKLFTIDAAFAAFEEDIKGSLKEGKLADMVIIDQDIMSIPASEIFKIKPVMTIVGGKIVYKAK